MRTVCGNRQEIELVKTMAEPPPSSNTVWNFKFGETVHASNSTCPITPYLLKGSSLSFEVAIIDVSIPCLIVLDVLWKNKIVLDFGRAYMRVGDAKWHLQFHYVSQHVFIIPNIPCKSTGPRRNWRHCIYSSMTCLLGSCSEFSEGCSQKTCPLQCSPP